MATSLDPNNSRRCQAVENRPIYTNRHRTTLVRYDLVQCGQLRDHDGPHTARRREFAPRSAA